MWRRNVIGKRCLFIGANDALVVALTKCFGWVETARLDDPSSLNTFKASHGEGINGEVQIIAACAFAMSKIPAACDVISQSSPSDTLGEIVKDVVAEIAATPTMSATSRGESPMVLYLVEEQLHTSQLLIHAISAGAQTYITCTPIVKDQVVEFDMRLIYRERGLFMNHQLAVAAVNMSHNMSPFQVRVMECLRNDIFSDREIAAALGTSEKMVSKTVGQLFEIFHCHRRSALAKHSIYL